MHHRESMFRITKFGYYLDFFVVPVLITVPLLLDQSDPVQWCSGTIAWTFVEYVVHRHVFHRRLRRDHWYHHLVPDAYVGVSGIVVTPSLAVFLLLSLMLHLGSFFSGFSFGYLCYIVVHDAIHHYNVITLFIGHRKRAHDLHHRSGAEINFGVTTGLWDKVFGTHVRN